MILRFSFIVTTAKALLDLVAHLVSLVPARATDHFVFFRNNRSRAPWALSPNSLAFELPIRPASQLQTSSSLGLQIPTSAVTLRAKQTATTLQSILQPVTCAESTHALCTSSSNHGERQTRPTSTLLWVRKSLLMRRKTKCASPSSKMGNSRRCTSKTPTTYELSATFI